MVLICRPDRTEEKVSGFSAAVTSHFCLRIVLLYLSIFLGAKLLHGGFAAHNLAAIA